MVAIHHVGLRNLGPVEEQVPLTVYAASSFLSPCPPLIFDSLTMLLRETSNSILLTQPLARLTANPFYSAEELNFTPSR